MQILSKHLSNLHPNNKNDNLSKKPNNRPEKHHPNIPSESFTFVLKASYCFQHILLKTYE